MSFASSLRFRRTCALFVLLLLTVLHAGDLAAQKPEKPAGPPQKPSLLRDSEDPPPDPEPEPEPEPEPTPPPPPPPSGPVLRGDTACTWGSADCNRCVPDVHAALSELRTEGDVAGFNMGPATDVTVYQHWEGVQRLAFGSGRFLAVSRKGAGVAFVVVEMGSRDGNGERFRSNRLEPNRSLTDTPPPAADVVLMEFPSDAGFDHAGGLQAIGKVLAVPLENGDTRSSRVIFFDLGTRLMVQRLHQTELSSTDAYQNPGHAGAVAVAKLADGRYLMIVAGHDSNTADFYISNTTSLLSTSTQFQRFHARSNGFDRPFQSINLITQCDGKLFLAGNYNTDAAGWGSDFVRWFELSNGFGTSVNVTFRGERHLVCTYRSAQQCNLVAAGGTYVDPAGRLLFYSTEHDNDGPSGSVKMEEFRRARPQDCPTADKAWVELFEHSNFGGRSVMIDFADRGLRNYENYDNVEAFGDKTSSARWCIPPGLRLRLFKDHSGGGSFRDLVGTNEEDNFDDIGFGDEVSSSRWQSF